MNVKATIIGLGLATSLTAAAQETNQFRQTDYSAFRSIGQQNIFNQYRVARHHVDGRPTSITPARIGDAFSLVGTMGYAKGAFAFFDGTGAEYRKIVRPGDAIADYKVTEITPHSVTLQGSGQKIEMTVGVQMRRDDEDVWKLIAVSELPATPASSAAASPAEPGSSSPGGDVNDVLKKLMQQREQELK
jgi:hypothetical protein